MESELIKRGRAIKAPVRTMGSISANVVFTRSALLSTWNSGSELCQFILPEPYGPDSGPVTLKLIFKTGLTVVHMLACVLSS